VRIRSDLLQEVESTVKGRCRATSQQLDARGLLTIKPHPTLQRVRAVTSYGAVGGQAHPVFVQAPPAVTRPGPPALARPPSLLAGQQLSCTRQTLTSDLSFIALKVKRSNSRTRTYWQLPSVNFTYLQLRNRGAQNRYITVTDPNCYLTQVDRRYPLSSAWCVYFVFFIMYNAIWADIYVGP